MLVAAPYLLAASICPSFIAGGGSGWRNLLVILFIWNALKLLLVGPISLILLMITLTRGHRSVGGVAWTSADDLGPCEGIGRSR